MLTPELPENLASKGALLMAVPDHDKGWRANGPALQLIRNARWLAAEQKARPARGMAALVRKIAVKSLEPLCVELQARGRNRTRGAIEVYEKDPVTNAMHSLGRTRFKVGPRWDKVRVDFQIRDTTKSTYLFVYLDAALGTRFGL